MEPVSNVGKFFWLPRVSAADSGIPPFGVFPLVRVLIGCRPLFFFAAISHRQQAQRLPLAAGSQICWLVHLRSIKK